MWTSLTSEGVEVLRLAAYECLQKWTALQLAVHNGWGGASSNLKCQQFHSDIVTFFTSSKERRYIDELEDFLDQCMLDFFNTEIEDGSLYEVAEQLMIMHEECMRGNYENVRKLSIPISRTGQSILDSKQLTGPDDEIGNSSANDEIGEEGDGMIIEDVSNVAVPLPPTTARNTVPISASTERTTTSISSLTEAEVADGWQDVSARKGRRGKK